MGFEVWIVIVLVASGLSGWVGYAYAKKEAPKQSELDAMSAELEEARQQAESVEANVSEHFEQSAMLFGKLAADYREFLDHFESSAQNLGLSEARARELIEQGFQPLLTHNDKDVVADSASEAEPMPENVEEDPAPTPVSEVTVEMPDDMAEDLPEEMPEQLAEAAEASESDGDKPASQTPSSEETASGDEDDQARQRA